MVEGTASETGTEFFRALVRNLAAVMGTAGAWVTEYLPEPRKLRALRVLAQRRVRRRLRVCHRRHGLRSRSSNRKSSFTFPDRLIELYPNEPTLKAMQAVSYLGVPLLDSEGEVMGHLSVLDNKPLPADPRRFRCSKSSPRAPRPSNGG